MEESDNNMKDNLYFIQNNNLTMLMISLNTFIS
jgi:hypothetical protein